MKCPNCGAENPDTETYCQGCAISLGSIQKVPMNRRNVILVSASIALLMCLLLSTLAMASVPGLDLGTKIRAGDQFTYNVLALTGDNITVSWDSSDYLMFGLISPSGSVALGTGSDSFSRTFSSVYQSGEWTLVWTNVGESTVKLSFDASSSSLDAIRGPLLTEVAWLVAVIVILIMTMVTVIVLVTRRLQLLKADESRGRRR